MKAGAKALSLRKPKDREKLEKSLRGQTEATLQGLCEAYLVILGLWYLRIPDEVYRVCAPHVSIHQTTKNAISENLAGAPDLFIFKKETISGTTCIDNSSLHVELKVGKNKQSSRQRKWARETVVHVVRNFEAFKELIDGWM